MQQAESVLAQISHHAQRPLCPSQANEIVTYYAILPQTMALDGSPKS